jgi:hypothetical protein
MRMLVLAALAITAFAATMTIDRTDANAVVCARGVYRAGCVGPHGAVVVHRPTTGTVIRSHTAPTPRVRKGAPAEADAPSGASVSVGAIPSLPNSCPTALVLLRTE